MNEQYFCRFFKKVIGRSPMEYVNEYRIKKAMHYLKESDLTVTEICLECGYNNFGNFLREFRKYTSTTPLQYRKRSLDEIENTDKQNMQKLKYRIFISKQDKTVSVNPDKIMFIEKENLDKNTGGFLQ